MNILHVTPHFFPFVGGLEHSVGSLSKEQQKAHQVTILTFLHDPGLEEKDSFQGGSIVRIPGRTLIKDRYPIPGFRAWQKALEDLYPEVIYTHTRFFWTSILTAFWILKRPREKRPLWIHIEHGEGPVKTQNPFLRGGAKLVDYCFGKYVLRGAQKGVVLTDRAQTFCQKLGARSVIKIRPALESPPAFAPLPQKKKALFIGRLVPEKGLKTLCRSLRQCPDWTLSIVGEGPCRARWSASNISWLGEKPAEEIPQILQEHDVLIHPSWAEGGGRTILEAAASGRAILATDVGIASEIIEPEFLFRRDDVQGIVRVLRGFTEEPDQMVRAGKHNAQKVAEKFSFSRMKTAHEKLLQELCHTTSLS